MFSQRCSQAFPLYTVNRGAEFLATLRLIYPYADTLCEKDFDWLFDCPQTKQFLEWFCSIVREENVLTPAELEAYDALLAAGKPILEDNALEQVLRMCCQLPGMIPDEKGPSVEALQQELQELQDYRERQLCRHRKLKAWAAKVQQQLKHLEEEEETVKQDLKKAQMDLEVKIVQTSAALGQISKDAKQLAEWYRDTGKGRPPTLLCEMDLGPYMELEQQATDAFERFIQQVLPGSLQVPDAQGPSAQQESSLKERLEAETQVDLDAEIQEGRGAALSQECETTPQRAAPASQGTLVQSPRAELLVEGRNRREVLSTGDEEKDGSQEATEKIDAKQPKMLKSPWTDRHEQLEDQDSWKEMCRMEKARICAQREIIDLSAKVEGSSAALKWAQMTLEALEENQQVAEAELRNQAATLQKQLHTLRCDITHTLTHQLPPLLKEEARASSLPILQKQFSLESARLQHIARKQEVAAAWLVSQRSRLDLLELQLKCEKKELDQKAARLEEMETAMREALSMLQKLQDHFKDASSSRESDPRMWIDPKDLFALRLWDMLMWQDQKMQCFRSYEAIAAQCSQLVQDQKVLEAQLTAPMPELPALETSTAMVYRQLYNSSNQLQLSSPEVTKLMQQLSTMHDNLYQMLADLLSDLHAKRRSLESPILQTERNLYVYFYCNEDRLREVVEELEKQAAASPRGPLMELQDTKE